MGADFEETFSDISNKESCGAWLGLVHFSAESHPGQVLDLRVGSDGGVAALLLAVLHVPQVEDAGDDV